MIEVTKGSLLIAEPFMRDLNFKRSVVLICRHENDAGSFGFSIGKGFAYTLNELVPELEGLDLPVYEGGPVNKNTLHFLHQFPDLIPGSFEVADKIYWGGDFETLKELLKNREISTKKIKFFVGYSGWDANQLKHEMIEGSWIVLPATEALIFKTPDDQIWKQSLIELGGDFKQMIHFPTDPQLN